MKDIKSYYGVFVLIVSMLFSVIDTASALPVHPYAPWRVNCVDKFNQTLRHPDNTFREVSSSETWRAELQNNKELKESSIRCWCKSDTQHEWDTEELGSGNGWWTMIQHLTSEGQECTCPAGQSIMVEMDDNTCDGAEVAHGFFHCSGCPGSTSIGTKAGSSSKAGSLWQSLGISKIAALL